MSPLSGALDEGLAPGTWGWHPRLINVCPFRAGKPLLSSGEGVQAPLERKKGFVRPGTLRDAHESLPARLRDGSRIGFSCQGTARLHRPARTQRADGRTIALGCAYSTPSRVREQGVFVDNPHKSIYSMRIFRVGQEP